MSSLNQEFYVIRREDQPDNFISGRNNTQKTPRLYSRVGASVVCNLLNIRKLKKSKIQDGRRIREVTVPDGSRYRAYRVNVSLTIPPTTADLEAANIFNIFGGDTATLPNPARIINMPAGIGIAPQPQIQDDIPIRVPFPPRATPAIADFDIAVRNAAARQRELRQIRWPRPAPENPF